MICVLLAIEYFVAIGKVCGKMLRILCDIALLYLSTIIVSGVLIAIAIVIILCCRENRKEYIYNKYGLKEFFSHNHSGKKVYTVLLIPLVNMFLSLMALLIAVTDFGDDF